MDYKHLFKPHSSCSLIGVIPNYMRFNNYIASKKKKNFNRLIDLNKTTVIDSFLFLHTTDFGLFFFLIFVMFIHLIVLLLMYDVILVLFFSIVYLF